MLEQDSFSEHNGRPAKHKDRSAAGFKIPKEWQNISNLSVQLRMYSKGNVPHLALEPTRYRSLDLVLSPTWDTEEDTVASVRSDFASGITTVIGNPRLWRRWFRTCSESHGKCRALNHKLQPFMPDRLVEISTDSDGNPSTWRSVHCTNIRNIQYLTLSHCWGSSRHTRLTRENESAYAKLSSSSGLPKTFRHALSITVLLGFRFVWIDSLCIFQDDLNDWETQASMMGSIYKNASCNIAATRAADGNDGCFTTRESRTITLDLGLGQSKEYSVDSWLLYYDDLMEAPLNSRGWVTQERYLAKRQLNFAKSQVYWECRELVASEQYTAGIPESLRNLSPYSQARPPIIGKPTLDYTSEAVRRKAWAALMDSYSDCYFSKLTDKTIALAGLAEEMRNTTGDMYLAGLWKKDLQRQLCWSTDFDVRWRVNRPLVPTYLAPTWSWMNVDGPVLSDQRYYISSIEYASCVKILDVSISSEHSTGLHSFVASSLVLRGIAVWARAMCEGNMANHRKNYEWTLQSSDLEDSSHSLLTASIKIEICWDENMSSSKVNPWRWQRIREERNSDLLCMFLYIDILADESVHGLLLRRLPGVADKDTYVRMGVFHIFDESFPERFSTRLGYPLGHSIVEDVDLDSVSLAGLVHTATIV